jgi:hypothetical protein
MACIYIFFIRYCARDPERAALVEGCCATDLEMAALIIFYIVFVFLVLGIALLDGHVSSSKLKSLQLSGKWLQYLRKES